MSFIGRSNETPEEKFLRTLPFVLNPALVRTSNLFRDLLANNSYQQFIMLVMGFVLTIDHPMKLTEPHFLSVLFLIKLFYQNCLVNHMRNLWVTNQSCVILITMRY